MSLVRESMGILFAVTGLAGGGAENALLNLCRHLVVQHPDIKIVVVCLVAGDEGPIATELARLNVKVLALRSLRKWQGALKLFRDFIGLRFFRPQLIQGWMYHGNLVAWGLRNLSFPGARLAGSVHSLWSQPKHVTLKLQTIRQLNLLAAQLDFDHIFFAGYESFQQHVKAGFLRTRGSILPNGVRFDEKERRAPSASELPVIVHVSRVHLDKGNETFVQTLAELEKRRFYCRVIVLGTGLDETFMHRMLPEYKTFRHVHVEPLGFRTDIRDFLRNAATVFLSSKSEAFPVSLVEGLGAGAVCVGTDVGDCREIIDDCGTTVPPERPDLLAEALVHWTTQSHRDRALWAARCRERAKKHFSLESMGRLYERIFTDLETVKII